MAFKLNGKTLPIDRGFTHNDIQYPRNWLRLSTQEDKDALGITWEADPVRHDDRYYWNGLLVLHGKQTLLGMMTDTTGMVN